MSTRIALTTDIHVGYSRDNLADTILGRFAQLIAQVNAANVDFIVLGGDMVENYSVDEMRRFKELALGFNAPQRAIAGNHDVGNRFLSYRRRDRDEVTVERVTRYEAEFGPSFWQENINDAVRVLGVNASLFGSDFPREDEQWQWLEAQLSTPSSLPTLLATHYPLYLEAPDEEDETEWNFGLLKSYWTIELRSRRRLLDLIERGDVKAVLSGHLHHPLRHRLDGVLYVSSPSAAFSLRHPHAPTEPSQPGWTLVTVTDEGEVEAQWQTLDD